jgi:NAD(P)-dependent dehydrogenase (short-subunit alcohol dehydrogenase family)
MPPRAADPVSLAGRAAVITGAARGIGAAIAATFVRAGASVALVDRDAEAVRATAAAIGGASAAWPADVCDAPSIAGAMADVVHRFGRLDILVNNAGIVRDARLENVTDADWDDTIAVDLEGVMACTRAAVPYMRAQSHGRILSATSVVARMGNFGQTAYAAAKAGVLGLTRALAREVGRRNIRVNAVVPGFVATEMTAGVPPEAVALLRSGECLPGGTTPAAVAGAVCFLLSDRAAAITGQALVVDAGASA